MNGVGLDLLEIDRMETALARRPSLAERLFTARERDYAATQARPGQHLAARFCAKEAVSKALGMEVLRPLDVEILGGGAVHLHGHAKARAQELGVEVAVSISHARETAGAVAVLR